MIAAKAHFPSDVIAGLALGGLLARPRASVKPAAAPDGDRSVGMMGHDVTLYRARVKFPAADARDPHTATQIAEARLTVDPGGAVDVAACAPDDGLDDALACLSALELATVLVIDAHMKLDRPFPLHAFTVELRAL